jgi:hypothetical protein
MAWTHYSCEISGKPASVLIDERFAPQFPIRELPRLSWFGVYCNQPTGRAFWNPEETDDLDRIETDLIKLSETFGHGWAVYVLRVATHGVREYYVYHADQAELSKVFSALKARYPNYRIEFETIDDLAWAQYGKYVSYEPDSTA